MNTLTDIPIEVLFSIIGFLVVTVGGIGAWIGNMVKDELRALRRESNFRGRQLTAINTVLGFLCSKAGIQYDPPDDSGGG